MYLVVHSIIIFKVFVLLFGFDIRSDKVMFQCQTQMRIFEPPITLQHSGTIENEFELCWFCLLKFRPKRKVRRLSSIRGQSKMSLNCVCFVS